MAYEVIKLTARNGSIEITSGNHFEDDDFYVEATGELKVNESTDDITVSVTPNEGYAFDHIEVDGDNLGNGYVSVDGNNGVATFHIRGLHDEAGSNYYGNTIVAVCDEEMGEAPAPDAPSNSSQTQCTAKVRNYIISKTSDAQFTAFYNDALGNYGSCYVASGGGDFAQWFEKQYAKPGEFATYINGLLSEGFTHLDVLAVLKYANDNMTRLEYTFNCIRNYGKKYGRYVEINGTTGNRGGEEQSFYEFHLKGGFSGEKAVINGVSYYVVDVIENNGYHTRDDGEGGTVREYREPVCTIDDGKCYFKSRTTTNPDDMFLYIEGMWFSVGYIATAFLVTSGNYTIKYSGNDISTSEMVAERFEGCAKQANAIMNKISDALSNGNIGKARDCAYGLELCYKGIERLLKEYL